LKPDWIFHDSHDLFFRRPFGAVPCGTKITIQVKVSCSQAVGPVLIRLWSTRKGEEKREMTPVCADGQTQTFRVELEASAEAGWMWYYFIVYCGNRVFYYGNNEGKLGGIGRIWEEQIPPGYQITVYQKDVLPPLWFQEAIIYQIFVDRFFRGTVGPPAKTDCYLHSRWDDPPAYILHPYTKKIIFDFFGGDLAGVLEKLPYLKELGVTAIYFNPIFEAPSNHKYDTADYKKIDSMFGDEEIFSALCAKASKEGISIILDGVFSHTGSDSIYFNKEGRYPGLGAYQSKKSPFFSWYQFDQYPEKYRCWWGVDTLPNVNEMDPSYLEFIIEGKDSVLKCWMKKGIKGWRLDVADELPDQFIALFRKTMREMDPSSVLIGEVWEDASNKVSYGEMRQYLLGAELDSVMNYPFRNILLDFFLDRKNGEETCHALLNLYENYPRHHFYTTMNLIGSHDVPRILTLLGDAPDESSLSQPERALYRLPEENKKLAVARLKLMVLWQMAFPGIPAIYYGDEAGAEGYTDPLNRAPFPWGKEDETLLIWYKRIIGLRKKNDMMKTGWWVPVYARGDVFGFVRYIENGRDVFQQPRKNGTALAIFNRNPRERVDTKIDAGRWCPPKMIDTIFGVSVFSQRGMFDISLDPLQGKLFIDEENYEN